MVGSKIGGCTGVFCKALSLDLHFRLNDDCFVYHPKIVTNGPTSGSESYIIIVDSQVMVWCSYFSHIKSLERSLDQTRFVYTGFRDIAV